MGESDFGENPNRCWAFAYISTKGEPRKMHPNPSKYNCCKTADTNADVPESLKNIVKIDGYGKADGYGNM